jgi:signal transduction histidine kinase/DNA-binding NarL/FixJ family response regulator
MKRLPLNILVGLLSITLLMLVYWDYVGSLREARLNYANESHNLALSDEARVAERVRWMQSTLNLMASDQVLQTFVAAGGPLPPLAKPRVQPAFDLLAQSSELLSLYVVSFYASDGGLLLELHRPKRGRNFEASREEFLALEGLQESLQSGNKDFVVSRAFQSYSTDVFYYAKPIVHRDRIVGLVALLFSTDELSKGLSPIVESVAEEHSGLKLVLPKSTEPAGQLYVESLHPAPHWSLNFNRPDRFFWERADVSKATQAALLNVVIIGLGLLAAASLAQRKAALEASRAKSDFMASISHEIRTPLNGVIGMTELALKTEVTPVQREYLRTVTSSAESVLSLINDLLDLSKMEAGALEFNPVSTDLTDLLHHSVRAFQHLAAERGVDLVLSVDQRLPREVEIDPLRLSQVLVNLLSNAVKFTHRGSVVLAAQVQEGGGISISVEDTGIGISPERQQAIFDPFQQASSDIVREYGGTGLGLSICRELIGRMGGSLQLESQPGRGSRFHFTLKPPIKVPAAVGPRPTQSHFLLEGLPGRTSRSLCDLLTTWGMTETNKVQEGIVVFCLPGEAAEFSSDVTGVTLVVVAEKAEELESVASARVFLKPIHPEHLRAHLTGQERQRVSESVGLCLKVLLVDDSPINRKLGRILLQDEGHSVKTVANGREALQASLAESFDLILMDLHMPEMNGLEAARRIRASGSSTPIIALTGNALSSDREKCLAAGMNAHLAKPIDERRLQSTIASLFSRAQKDGTSEARHRTEREATKVFDPSLSLRRVGGDPKNVLRVIELFLALLPEQLTVIEKPGGTKEVKLRALTTLRGAVSPFEAKGVLDAVQVLEKMVISGGTEQERAIFELTEQTRILQRALEEFVSEKES